MARFRTKRGGAVIVATGNGPAKGGVGASPSEQTSETADQVSQAILPALEGDPDLLNLRNRIDPFKSPRHRVTEPKSCRHLSELIAGERIAVDREPLEIQCATQTAAASGTVEMGTRELGPQFDPLGLSEIELLLVVEKL